MRQATAYRAFIPAPLPPAPPVQLHGELPVSVRLIREIQARLLLRERHRADITARLGRAAGNGHRVLERLFTDEAEDPQ